VDSRKKQRPPAEGADSHPLEVVLKCDVTGTEEAVRASLETIQVPGAAIRVIQSGVGNISKSDVLMALTGSRLVIGFNVDVMPRLQREIQQHGVEVRLYDTIYKITEDVRRLAEKLVIPPEPAEKVTGKARVIATFKGKPGSMVIGCEVLEGVMEAGKKFRVITAMGPAHFGTITSMQVEKQAVKRARVGQQVGIHLDGWDRAKEGDLVECFETTRPRESGTWKPRGGVFRYDAG